MKERRRIDFDNLREKILLHLYEEFFDDRVTYSTRQRIRRALGEYPANAILMELERLVDGENVDQETATRERTTRTSGFGIPSYEPVTYQTPIDGYRISRSGIELVQKWSDEKYETLRASVYGQHEDATKENGRISDQEWEPMPLDRDTAEGKEALQQTELALKEIEQNNGYASTDPDERNGIVETIKGSLTAIKFGFPSKQVVIVGLLAPLRFIAKKFSEASMGEAAKTAVAALIKWLF